MKRFFLEQNEIRTHNFVLVERNLKKSILHLWDYVKFDIFFIF